jgi:AraC family transcriptional activator of pobA
MTQHRQSQLATFDIQTLEGLTDHRPDLLRSTRKSDSFEIIWIISGSGTYTIDFESHSFDGQSVFFADAGQLHAIQAREYVKGYRISFSFQFLAPSEVTECFLFRFRGQLYSTKTKFIKPDCELQLEMAEIVAKMQKEIAGYSPFGPEVLSGLMNLLLIHLTRRLGAEKSGVSAGKGNDLVRRFMLLLEENATRKKMVCDFASELCVTANYLNEIIKRATGFPAHYHINQRRVLEAKRQAIQYRISMKQIAYNLGYDDIAHFSKFFKINAGLRFQDFKKQILAVQW